MQEFCQIGNVTVYKHNGAIVAIAPVAVDCDGAPNAYNADDTGIDYLANAGEPGNWYGLVTNEDNNPVEKDGYYISCTALEDSNHPVNSSKRYCDANTIPYIVLPSKSFLGLGDYALVINLDNGKHCWSIAADFGPKDQFGEGSVALVRSLGVEPIVDGRAKQGIEKALYVFFPASRTNLWRSDETVAEIEKEAIATFQRHGGTAFLSEIATKLGLRITL